VPYRAAAAILLAVLLTGAVVVTIGRATRGMHGQSAIQGRIFGGGGFLAMAGYLARRGHR
jgi:hypothetical protein